MASIAEVTQATAAATKAAHTRDQKIRAAHKNGATIRAIAAAAGISFQRVHQIIHGR